LFCRGHFQFHRSLSLKLIVEVGPVDLHAGTM
jgi:hypothetical protein